ncbi:hypothetical protein NX868_06965 [Burkholderia thailandensis]|uniref:hypothetical protein n=1 Tax=Burkholderia thailandensis TaxID=57975 RepID=UPI0009B603C6|nr:hypothetical protein [Burkholderia thailandensis]MCS3395418.1 hypothetical protein [Burkholderia thailandensis]MCS6424092.1 hypothetical protein [Burkholderia thailandensis]MCS6456776.1 hypothetical protein [Burkholderia thailandensis]MCS6464256.1 hypothetical protein [Burkholderia thailandensis]MCS6482023.1 hypothetical protein [Burkholderia thailandensis]
MSTHFLTNQAKKLLDSFNAKIEQTEQKGKITTWEKVTHNNATYYTHKSTEWRNEAFFLPKVESDKLTFNIIHPNGKTITIQAYGYYHGHLIETFLNHFDEVFSSAHASAGPQAGDIIS